MRNVGYGTSFVEGDDNAALFTEFTADRDSLQQLQ